MSEAPEKRYSVTMTITLPSMYAFPIEDPVEILATNVDETAARMVADAAKRAAHHIDPFGFWRVDIMEVG